MRLVAATVAVILSVLSLCFVVRANNSSAHVIQGGGGEDPLFEEQWFSLDPSSIRSRRKLSHYRYHRRDRKTRTLSWPECKGMTVQDCKDYIEDYIVGRYHGHVIEDLKMLVRQPRVDPLMGDDTYYYFAGVRSNLFGESACTVGDSGAPIISNTVSLIDNNGDNGSWIYANGTKYTIPNLDCLGKTNAQCCDLIWNHGEWMGLDRDGKHLTCYVYQEPTYPFFRDYSDPQYLVYPTTLYREYRRKPDCFDADYRVAELKDIYKEAEDKIYTEVLQMINNLFEPIGLPGHCVDRKGKIQKGGKILLFRESKSSKITRSSFLNKCFQRCIDYEMETGAHLTGCESIYNGDNKICVGHTAEVFRGRDAIIERPHSYYPSQFRYCAVDPVRNKNRLRCRDLKFVIDNYYNYARMPHLHGLMGRVQFEFYHEHCISQGKPTLPISLELKNLLFAIRDGARNAATIKVVNFVYILAGSDGIVTETPRVGSTNPAFYPHLKHLFE